MRSFTHHRHGSILVTPHVHALLEKDRAEACPQRTDGWYRKRQDHLTASAIATACGANPYETRAKLIRGKTGRERDPFTGNAATEHGNKYEQEAIEKYERLTGEKAIEFGLLESINPGEEFIAGSPDGITASGRCIEVKCPFRRVPSETVPEHYLYQVQTLMHILKLPVCDFIQYVPESHWKAETFIITVVRYDPYFWQAKFPKLQRVWQEVLDIRGRMAAGTFADSEDEEDEEADAGGVNAVPDGVVISVPRTVELLVEPPAPAALVAPEPTVDGPDPRWQGLSDFFDRVAAAPRPPPRARAASEDDGADNRGLQIVI
jgi:putative phage-type endonuclease